MDSSAEMGTIMLNYYQNHIFVLYSSAELGPILLNYYQTYIGELIWMVDLGRIGIITEVSMLATQLVLP